MYVCVYLPGLTGFALSRTCESTLWRDTSGGGRAISNPAARTLASKHRHRYRYKILFKYELIHKQQYHVTNTCIVSVFIADWRMYKVIEKFLPLGNFYFAIDVEKVIMMSYFYNFYLYIFINSLHLNIRSIVLRHKLLLILIHNLPG